MEKPTYENHENWYPTNKSDFTVAEFTTIYAITTKLVRSNHVHSEIQLDIDILTNAVLA
jgi:hypothetical protein